MPKFSDHLAFAALAYTLAVTYLTDVLVLPAKAASTDYPEHDSDTLHDSAKQNAAPMQHDYSESFPGDQFQDFFGSDWFYGIQMCDKCWTESMLERVAAEAQMLRVELRNECEIRKIRNETFDGSTYVSPILKEYLQNSASNVRSWRAPSEAEVERNTVRGEDNTREVKYIMREPAPEKLPSPFYLNHGIITMLMDYHLSNRGTFQTYYGTHYDRLFFGPEYYAEEDSKQNQGWNENKHNQNNNSTASATDSIHSDSKPIDPKYHKHRCDIKNIAEIGIGPPTKLAKEVSSVRFSSEYHLASNYKMVEELLSGELEFFWPFAQEEFTSKTFLYFGAVCFFKHTRFWTKELLKGIRFKAGTSAEYAKMLVAQEGGVNPDRHLPMLQIERALRQAVEAAKEQSLLSGGQEKPEKVSKTESEKPNSTNDIFSRLHTVWDRAEFAKKYFSEAVRKKALQEWRTEIQYIPGSGLRAWRDFFPNADIYGFDVDPLSVKQTREHEKELVQKNQNQKSREGRGGRKSSRDNLSQDSEGSSPIVPRDTRVRVHPIVANSVNRTEVTNALLKTVVARSPAASVNGSKGSKAEPAATPPSIEVFDVIVDDGLHTWEGNRATLSWFWPFLKRDSGVFIIEDLPIGYYTNGIPYLERQIRKGMNELKEEKKLAGKPGKRLISLVEHEQIVARAVKLANEETANSVSGKNTNTNTGEKKQTSRMFTWVEEMGLGYERYWQNVEKAQQKRAAARAGSRKRADSEQPGLPSLPTGDRNSDIDEDWRSYQRYAFTQVFDDVMEYVRADVKPAAVKPGGKKSGKTSAKKSRNAGGSPSLNFLGAEFTDLPAPKVDPFLLSTTLEAFPDSKPSPSLRHVIMDVPQEGSERGFTLWPDVKPEWPQIPASGGLSSSQKRTSSTGSGTVSATEARDLVNSLVNTRVSTSLSTTSEGADVDRDPASSRDSSHQQKPLRRYPFVHILVTNNIEECARCGRAICANLKAWHKENGVLIVRKTYDDLALTHDDDDDSNVVTNAAIVNNDLRLPFPLSSETANSQQGAYGHDAFDIAQWSHLRDVLHLVTFNGGYEIELRGKRFRWRLEEVVKEEVVKNVKDAKAPEVPGERNQHDHYEYPSTSLLSLLNLEERSNVLGKLQRIIAPHSGEAMQNPLMHILEILIVAETRGYIALLNGRCVAGPPGKVTAGRCVSGPPGSADSRYSHSTNSTTSASTASAEYYISGADNNRIIIPGDSSSGSSDDTRTKKSKIQTDYDSQSLLMNLWAAGRAEELLFRFLRTQPRLSPLLAAYPKAPSTSHAIEQDIVRLLVRKLQNENVHKRNSQGEREHEAVTVTLSASGDSSDSSDSDIGRSSASPVGVVRNVHADLTFPLSNDMIGTPGRLIRLLIPEVDVLLDLIVAVLLTAPEYTFESCCRGGPDGLFGWLRRGR